MNETDRTRPSANMIILARYDEDEEGDRFGPPILVETGIILMFMLSEFSCAMV